MNEPEAKPYDRRRDGRYLGTAKDARMIAEAIIGKKDVPRPRRKRTPLRELARYYADAITLQTLYRMEQLVQDPSTTAKDVVAILTALREHYDWAKTKEQEKLSARPAWKTRVGQTKPDVPDMKRFDREAGIEADAG